MSTIKSWDRPWSMDEMIDNSNNWSLAGDVALLNSLQNFADKLLEKTNQTNDNIENLINNLEETNLQLNIAQNRFQNLRNTQFIESRVYEDDDDDGIVQLENDDNSKKIEDRDDDHRDDISTAISRGLDILDHYFDKIQVTVSDSDDDDDDNDRISDKDQDQNDLQSVILKPKDLYINRPLPYVIGTDEWHKKWHVGLEDSSDDSDTEKISDNYSESDSESTDLQLIFDRSQIKSSDTSSEFDNNNKQTKQQLTKDDQQSTTTSGSDEIIKQTTTTTSNFAQQLAEKLDRVVGNTGTIEEKPEIIPEPEVNTRPIQKLPTKSTNYRDIFFDEPPPLDDIPPVNRHGLFSGGGGLFDDNDDDNDDLWSSKSSKPQPIINDKNTNQTNEQSGLFNDDDEDDDIFKTKEPSKVLPTVFQKSQLPVFNDEPPPVKEPKKPIGGISIFGGNELLNQQLLKRRQISDEDPDIDNDKKTNDETIEEPPQIINDKNDKTVETKKISLFDDDDDDGNDDLFKDDLFTSNITSKKFTSTLFNDNDDDKNDDLFTEQSNHPDDSINSLKNDDSLKLFDDTTPSVSNDDIFNDLPKITEDITSKSSTLKLFDDDDDDNNDDDLFKLNIDKNQTNENKPDINIFDTTPPILNDNNDDDDDFNCSRKFLSQQLFDDDIVDIKPESSKISNRSVIEDQPPKLDDDDDPDNHQKIQSPGKLKHNLNINVAALIPGGLPPLKRNDISKIEVRKPEINEISTGFDTTDRVEVLQSVTKARARLPLNRRPSTRRGRKAALETSSKDFKLNNDRIDNTNDIDDVINEEIDKKSELLQSDDNFDDLFKNDENSKCGNVAKVDDLFGGIQKSEVKKVDTVKTRGLFDDDDDDDENNDADLFTTRKQPVVKKTKSLFDDDDDLDDDIFKTTANHSKKPEVKPTTTDRKLSKPSGNIKKLDHSQPDDDPLGILNLNDN